MATDGNSTGPVPQFKAQTLIVVQAFKRDKRSGEIVPSMDAREMPDAPRAIARAKELSTMHAGAIAWSRIVKPDEGEFADPIVLFSRGELPDLDMPVRQDELDDDNGGEQPDGSGDDDDDDDGGRDKKWRGFQLAKAADWQAFHQAFLKLYRQQEDRELLTAFTAIENRRIVILPSEAAALVAKGLPSCRLGPCARPPGSALRGPADLQFLAADGRRCHSGAGDRLRARRHGVRSVGGRPSAAGA